MLLVQFGREYLAAAGSLLLHFRRQRAGSFSSSAELKQVNNRWQLKCGSFVEQQINRPESVDGCPPGLKDNR